MEFQIYPEQNVGLVGGVVIAAVSALLTTRTGLVFHFQTSSSSHTTVGSIVERAHEEGNESNGSDTKTKRVNKHVNCEQKDNDASFAHALLSIYENVVEHISHVHMSTSDYPLGSHCTDHQSHVCHYVL